MVFNHRSLFSWHFPGQAPTWDGDCEHQLAGLMQSGAEELVTQVR